MCTDIERSPFSSRASQGQIVALRMGRLEGRHCNSCSDACVNFNLKALYVVCPPRPAPSGRDGLPGPSVLCVSNSESYCVRRSRGFFNCLATGELFKLDGLLLPVSVSQIAVFALRDQGPVRCHSICCWVSGPAPCCFFSVVRDSTLPSLANPKIS